MHVLVTGAGGRIGRAVVSELIDHGHQVRGLVLDPPAESLPVETIVGDCRDPRTVDEALDGMTAVAHLAAIPSPVNVKDEDVFANNTQATFVVLDRAARAGIEHAVITSSISVLGLAYGREGMSPHYVPIDENHPILAEDPYALSKQVDEHTALMMHRRYGIDVAALRLSFTAEGERLAERAQEARRDPGALSRELWAYLHTADAAVAYRLALERRPAGMNVINVMAEDTLSDLPSRQLVDRYHPTAEIREPLGGRVTPYDLRRARQLLGFRATRTPDGVGGT